VVQAYPFVVRKVLRNEQGTAPLLREMLYDPATGGQVFQALVGPRKSRQSRASAS
jgi:hypothetical protein